MELFGEITNWINSSFCPYKINRAFEILPNPEYH